VYFIKDCGILILGRMVFHNPVKNCLESSGVGALELFQIIVEKIMIMTYNILNRTAGR